MARRPNAAPRCAGCHLHLPLCACALMPRLAPSTQLRLFVHAKEARKPTNTGLLAVHACAGATSTVVGLAHEAAPEREVAPGTRPLLLYPGDDAVRLTDVAEQGPYTLFVPDGSWRQASKMRGRFLRDLPCATLGRSYETRYRLRQETKDGGMATLEAIARALAELEGARGQEMAEQLLAWFEVVVDRMLWMRGSLPTSAVHGGIPKAALAAFRPGHAGTTATPDERLDASDADAASES